MSISSLAKLSTKKNNEELLKHYFPDYRTTPNCYGNYFTYKGQMFLLEPFYPKNTVCWLGPCEDIEDYEKMEDLEPRASDYNTTGSIVEDVFRSLHHIFKYNIGKDNSHDRIMPLEEALKGEVLLDVVHESQMIVFITENKIICCDTEDEHCCYAHIESLEWELDKDKLFPSKSFRIEATSSKTEEGPQFFSCSEDEGICEFTFYTLYLDKGRGSLEFRSESNGAYEGSLNLNEVFVFDKGFL